MANFSKEEIFLIYVLNQIWLFVEKEIWSFLKVLDYQILEELINLRFKCSFLSLVQVTPRVQVTPFFLWYRVLAHFPVAQNEMISEREENKGVNLHVVEIDWEVKKFHTNFHDVLERGGGVETKRWDVLPWTNRIMSAVNPVRI